MNILLFTLEYPPFKGGIAHYYSNLVTHYPEKDNVFVLHNNNHQLLSNDDKLSWLIAFKSLWHEIKNKEIKHVLVGHILPLGTVTYLLSKILRFEYSVILHGMDFVFMQKKSHKKFLGKLILKNAKNIFCGNKYLSELVLEFLGDKFKDKIVIVNPGLNTNELQIINNELQINLKNKYDLNNKFILFSIGRLVERKGFDRVIEVMNELQDVNIKYVLIGDGPNKERIDKMIGDNKNIIFINEKVSDEEKNAWFDICNVFIMPSRNIDGDFEGFGIVYLEANLHKKPVIAGNSGGVSDAVLNEINGLLINPEDNTKIKNAILTLFDDEVLCEKLGSQGKKRVQQEFSWIKQIKKISDRIN
ncbi:glycosyltransferase family 4 protein [Candidatus Parcubacteria bacterium]|nr:glycosyltransferase family 4 protein [Candidatus Parcubacteria bacterium]